MQPAEHVRHERLVLAGPLRHEGVRHLCFAAVCSFFLVLDHIFLPVNYATHLNPPLKPQNANPPSLPKRLKHRWVKLRKVAGGGLTHFVTAPANPLLKFRGGGA